MANQLNPGGITFSSKGNAGTGGITFGQKKFGSNTFGQGGGASRTPIVRLENLDEERQKIWIGAYDEYKKNNEQGEMDEESWEREAQLFAQDKLFSWENENQYSLLGGLGEAGKQLENHPWKPSILIEDLPDELQRVYLDEYDKRKAGGADEMLSQQAAQEAVIHQYTGDPAENAYQQVLQEQLEIAGFTMDEYNSFPDDDKKALRDAYENGVSAVDSVAAYLFNNKALLKYRSGTALKEGLAKRDERQQGYDALIDEYSKEQSAIGVPVEQVLGMKDGALNREYDAENEQIMRDALEKLGVRRQEWSDRYELEQEYYNQTGVTAEELEGALNYRNRQLYNEQLAGQDEAARKDAEAVYAMFDGTNPDSDPEFIQQMLELGITEDDYLAMTDEDRNTLLAKYQEGWPALYRWANEYKATDHPARENAASIGDPSAPYHSVEREVDETIRRGAKQYRDTTLVRQVMEDMIAQEEDALNAMLDSSMPTADRLKALEGSRFAAANQGYSEFGAFSPLALQGKTMPALTQKDLEKYLKNPDKYVYEFREYIQSMKDQLAVINGEMTEEQRVAAQQARQDERDQAKQDAVYQNLSDRYRQTGGDPDAAAEEAMRRRNDNAYSVYMEFSNPEFKRAMDSIGVTQEQFARMRDEEQEMLRTVYREGPEALQYFQEIYFRDGEEILAQRGERDDTAEGVMREGIYEYNKENSPAELYNKAKQRELELKKQLSSMNPLLPGYDKEKAQQLQAEYEEAKKETAEAYKHTLGYNVQHLPGAVGNLALGMGENIAAGLLGNVESTFSFMRTVSEVLHLDDAAEWATYGIDKLLYGEERANQKRDTRKALFKAFGTPAQWTTDNSFVDFTRGLIAELQGDATQRGNEKVIPQLTDLIRNFNQQIDQQTAEAAAKTVVEKMAYSGGENFGHMIPSMLMMWASAGLGAWTGPAEIGTDSMIKHLGKSALEAMRTPGFLQIFMDETGRYYQEQLADLGDKMTDADRWTALAVGWFNAVVEYRETALGVQFQSIASGRVPLNLRTFVGTMVGETSEELRQLAYHDIGENFADMISGRAVRHELDNKDYEDLFYWAKYLDTAKDTMLSTAGMTAIQGGVNRFTSAVQAVKNGTATQEQQDDVVRLGVMADEANLLGQDVQNNPGEDQQHAAFAEGLGLTQGQQQGQRQTAAPSPTQAQVEQAQNEQEQREIFLGALQKTGVDPLTIQMMREAPTPEAVQQIMSTMRAQQDQRDTEQFETRLRELQDNPEQINQLTQEHQQQEEQKQRERQAQDEALRQAREEAAQRARQRAEQKEAEIQEARARELTQADEELARQMEADREEARAAEAEEAGEQQDVEEAANRQRDEEARAAEQERIRNGYGDLIAEYKAGRITLDTLRQRYEELVNNKTQEQETENAARAAEAEEAAEQEEVEAEATRQRTEDAARAAEAEEAAEQEEVEAEATRQRTEDAARAAEAEETAELEEVEAEATRQRTEEEARAAEREEAAEQPAGMTLEHKRARAEELRKRIQEHDARWERQKDQNNKLYAKSQEAADALDAAMENDQTDPKTMKRLEKEFKKADADYQRFIRRNREYYDRIEEINGYRDELLQLENEIDEEETRQEALKRMREAEAEEAADQQTVEAEANRQRTEDEARAAETEEAADQQEVEAAARQARDEANARRGEIKKQFKAKAREYSRLEAELDRAQKSLKLARDNARGDNVVNQLQKKADDAQAAIDRFTRNNPDFAREQNELDDLEEIAETLENPSEDAAVRQEALRRLREKEDGIQSQLRDEQAAEAEEAEARTLAEEQRANREQYAQDEEAKKEELRRANEQGERENAARQAEREEAREQLDVEGFARLRRRMEEAKKKAQEYEEKWGPQIKEHNRLYDRLSDAAAELKHAIDKDVNDTKTIDRLEKEYKKRGNEYKRFMDKNREFKEAHDKSNETWKEIDGIEKELEGYQSRLNELERLRDERRAARQAEREEAGEQQSVEDEAARRRREEEARAAEREEADERAWALSGLEETPVNRPSEGPEGETRPETRETEPRAEETPTEITPQEPVTEPRAEEEPTEITPENKGTETPEEEKNPKAPENPATATPENPQAETPEAEPTKETQTEATPENPATETPEAEPTKETPTEATPENQATETPEAEQAKETPTEATPENPAAETPEAETQKTEPRAEEAPTEATPEETDEQRRQNAKQIAQNYGFHFLDNNQSSTPRAGVNMRSWSGSARTGTAQIQYKNSGRTAMIDLADLKSIDEWGKRRGVAIIVDHSLQNGRANGEYRQGEGLTVHIAQDAENPLRTVFGHELYHAIAATNARAAARMQQAWLDYAQRAGLDMTHEVEKLKTQYREHGFAVPSDSVLREEVVANSLYDVIGDQRTIQVLAAQDRGLVQQIRNFVSKVMQDIRAITSKYADRNAGARMLRDTEGAMQAMRDMIDQALKESEPVVKSKQAVKALGENGVMTKRYQDRMEKASNRQEANKATRQLAQDLLRRMGVEANEENVRNLLGAALDFNANGKTMSWALQRAGFERVQMDAEMNRAFGMLAKYMDSIIGQDTKGYMDLMKGEPETQEQQKPQKPREPAVRKLKRGDDVKLSLKNGVTPAEDAAKEIKRIVDEMEYEYYGLRVDRAGFQKGHVFDNSYEWFDEEIEGMEFNEDAGLWQGEELEGVSTIAISKYATEEDIKKALKKMGPYRYAFEGDRIIYLVGGNERAERGYDPDELVITDGEVIGTYSFAEDDRYSIKDSVYMEAVEKGDMKTAQEMVDQAAKEAGYDPSVKLYHGTNRNGFTVFNTDAIFTTTNQMVASGYANKSLNGGTEFRAVEDNGNPDIIIKNAENVLNRKFTYEGDGRYREENHKSTISEAGLKAWIEEESANGVYEGYGNLGSNPLIIDAKGADWKSIKVGRRTVSTDQIVKAAKKSGYTSVVIKNVLDPDLINDYGDDYIFFDSRQFKTAEPVTHDDQGRVIPLSERFDPSKEDIRWSLKDTATVEQLQKELEDANRTVEDLTDRVAKQAEEIKRLRKEGKGVQGQQAENLRNLTQQLNIAIAGQLEAEHRLEVAGLEISSDRNVIQNLRAQKNEYQRKYEEQKAENRREFSAWKHDYRESRQQAERREKNLKNINKAAVDLNRMIEHPSKKKGYVPMEMMEAARVMADAVNAGRGMQDAMEDFDRLISRARYDEGQWQGFSVATKAYVQEALNVMEEARQKNGGEAELTRNLKPEDIDIIAAAVQGVVHDIRTAGQLIGQERARDAQEEAAEAIRDANKHPRVKKGAKELARLFFMNQTNPKTMFDVLDGGRNTVWGRMGDEMQGAQRKCEFNLMKYEKVFNPLLEGKDNARKYKRFTGKNAVLIETGMALLDENGEPTGRNAEISHAQLCSLYMNRHIAENLEAMRVQQTDEQIMKNGERYQMSVPDAELLKKGKLKEAVQHSHRVIMTLSEIDTLLEEMTDYDKKFCEAWREAAKIWRADLNEASNKLVGFDIARVDDYFTITRDQNYVNGNFESVVVDNRIANMGITHERVKSTKPVVLMPIVDMIKKQNADVSVYSGWAVAMRDFQTLYFSNAAGYDTSFREAIIRNFGSQMAQYFEDLARDINGDGKVRNTVIDALRSNIAKGLLAGNMAVTVKQAASIANAIGVLDPDCVMKALPYYAALKKINAEKLSEYTAAFYMRQTGTMASLEANANRESMAAKGVHAALDTIRAMDEATTRVLIKACEFQVQKNNPELEVGTDAYWKEVAKKYDPVIEETQPSSGVMQKNPLQRNKSTAVQAMIMFRTQLWKNLNRVIKVTNDVGMAREMLKENPSSEEAKQNLKAKQRTMALTISGQVASAVMIAVLNMLGKMLLHKTDDYKDEKGDITMGAAGGRLAKDTISSMAGMVLGGSELFDFINGVTEGKAPYDIEAVGVSTINDLQQNLFGVINAGDTLADSSLSAGEKVEKLRPRVWKLAGTIGELFGVPVNNIRNLLDGLIANGKDLAAGKPLSFESTGWDFLGAARGRNTSNADVAGYIARAMASGDTAEAERLYNGQLAQGKTPQSLNTAIANWQKENIPQIKQAAQAIEDGDISLYNRLVREITEQGVSTANAVKYVESERKKLQEAAQKKEEENENRQTQTPQRMTYDQITAGMTKEASDLLYTNGMMNSLLEDGNVAQAVAVKNAMLESGKKQSAINSSLTSYWKPILKAAYDAGDMQTVRQITEMLMEMGMNRSTIQGWTGTKSSGSSGFGSRSFGSGSFGSGSFGKSSFGSGTFGSGSFGTTAGKKKTSSKKRSSF